jgi:hypothetical protein
MRCELGPRSLKYCVMFGSLEARQLFRAACPHTRQTLRRLPLRSLLWGSLLGVHALPLWKAWRSAFGPDPSDFQFIAPLWLSLAVVFFILKLFDLRCLRFRTDRRSILIVTFAILLMHSSALGFPTDAVAIPGEMPLLTSLLLLFGLESVHELIAAVAVAARRAAGLTNLTRRRARENATLLVREFALLALVPRAPPIPR